MKKAVKSVVFGILAVSAFAQAKSVQLDAKALLVKAQTAITSAKTMRVTMREEVGGVKTEAKFVSKQNAKGVLSFRQETQALLPGRKPPALHPGHGPEQALLFPNRMRGGGCEDGVQGGEDASWTRRQPVPPGWND